MKVGWKTVVNASLVSMCLAGTFLFEAPIICATPVHHHGPRSMVFETADISDIAGYVDEATLVVLDLDNTTFRSKTTLGGGDWFYRKILSLINEGLTKQKALKEFYSEFTRVQNYTQMELCDEQLPALLDSFRAKGAGVIGLTSRCPIVAPVTLNMLKEIDCTFTENPFEKNSFYLKQVREACFSEGVIFANDLNMKGVIFDQFINQIGEHQYKRVVFVDDMKHNIQSMESAVLAKGLEYIGVRYSAQDGRLQQLDMRIADLQQRYLFSVIPDEVAKKILKTPGGQVLLAEYRDPVMESKRSDDTLVPTKVRGRSSPPPFKENDIPVEIITSDRIDVVLDHANENTLFVFDLNDTLTAATTYLGGDIWAKNVLNSAIKAGLSKEEAHDRLVPFWHEVIRASSVRPVETNTALVMRALQKRGCPCMGLTARYVEMAYPTLGHLHSIGVDFSSSPIAGNDFTVLAPYPAKFFNGVVFAGLQNDKAEVLIRFLEQQPVPFDKLVFVDDKEKNVKGMAKAARTLGKPYVGVWYTSMQKQKTIVDEDVGRIQQVLFHRIIPDSIAKELL